MSENLPLSFGTAEEQFLTVANQLITGIAQTDLAGQFVLVNDSYCEIVGYTREELLTKTLFDLTVPDDRERNRKLFRKCIEEGAPYIIEKKYIRKDGSEIWVRNSVSLLRDAFNKPRFVTAVSTDVSREKLSRQMLEKSDERYRAFITQSSEAIWRFELDEPISTELSPDEQIEKIYQFAYLAECNTAMARMYGFQSGDEIVGARLSEFLPREDRTNLEYLRAFIQSGYRLENAESHEFDREGNPKFFLNNLVGVVENGKILRAWGTQRDITEQKQVEQRIRESEERYRIVAETASDAIIQIDEEKNILFVNQAAERIFGYGKDELTGQKLEVLIPEFPADGKQKKFAAENGKKIIVPNITEVSARRKDGQRFPLEISFDEFNANGNRFFIGIARDISARKESEKANSHLAAIVESSEDAIISKDLRGRILSWNKGAERIFGYTAEEVIGKNILILVPPHLFDEEKKILEKIKRGKPTEHYETVRRRKDGSTIYISLTVSPIRDENGKIIGASKIARDISLATEVENELRESQAMLALTMRSSRMGIWSREIGTDNVWWSVELEEIFGLPRGGFNRTESGFYDLIFTDDRLSVRQEIERAIAAKREYVVEFRFHHADGSIRWLEERGQAVYSDRGEPVRLYGIGIDITERKKVGEKIRESEERLRLATEAAEMFAWEIDLQTQKIKWADNTAEIIGCSPETLSEEAENALFFVDPKDRDRLLAELRQILGKGETSFVFEFNGIDQGNETKFWQAQGSIISDENGVPVRVVGVTQNVSERKQNEEKLRIANYRFRVAEEAAKGFLFDWDLENDRVVRSENFSRVLGYDPSEIPETLEAWRNLIHPDDKNLTGQTEIESINNAADGHLENEYRVRHKDGHYVYLYERSIIFPGENGKARRIIGQTIDVTERKKAEEITERYRLLSERASDAILFLLTNGQIVDANKAAIELYGYDREKLLQMNIADLRMPETLTELSAQLKTANERGIQFETLHHNKAGGIIPVEVSSVGATIGNERFLMSIIRDITERKESEEKIKRSAERAEVAQEAARAALYEYRPQSGEIIHSHAIESIIGYAPAEILATEKGWLKLIHPNDFDMFWKIVDQSIRKCEGYSLEYRIRHKNGHYVWVSDRARIVSDQEGNAERVVGMIVDITERKIAENRLSLIAEISELSRRFEDTRDLLFAVAKAVGEHLQVKRCLFNEIDLENDLEIVHRDYCRGAESVAGTHKISAYSSMTTSEMLSGKTVVNRDSKEDARTAELFEQIYEPNGERAYVAVPLLRENRWVASLWVSDDVPRNWTEKEIGWLETIAERAWLAVEKLRVEQNVRESQLHLQITTEAAQVGTWQWNIKSNELIWSPIHKKLWGYAPTPEHLSYEDWQRLIDPQDLNRVLRAVENCLQGKNEYDIEYRIKPLGSSELRWIRSTGRANFNEAGEPVSMQGVSLDATERKQAEEKLRESEERYRTLFDSIDEGFCIVEMIFDGNEKPVDYRFLQANPAFARLTGLENALGKTARQLVPDLEEFWFENYGQVALTGKSVRFEHKSEPMKRWFDVYASRVGDAKSRRVAIVFNNITERKKAERALIESARQQEALYHLSDQLHKSKSLENVYNAALQAVIRALKGNRASILLTDDAGKMKFVAWHGLSDEYRQETEGHSPWKPDEKNPEPVLLDNIDSAEMSDSLKAVIKKEGIAALAFIPLVSNEKLIGKFMLYFDEPHVFTDIEIELGLTIARQLAFGIDRKRADDAVRESEKLYRTLFDLVPVAVYTCDKNGVIQEFNQRAVELWGREASRNNSRELFCGSTKIFYPDGRVMPHENCPMARALRGETVLPQESEILIEQPDGTRKNVIAIPQTFKNEGGEIVGAINCLYDITDRKQAQDALIKAERKAAEEY